MDIDPADPPQPPPEAPVPTTPGEAAISPNIAEEAASEVAVTVPVEASEPITPAGISLEQAEPTEAAPVIDQNAAMTPVAETGAQEMPAEQAPAAAAVELPATEESAAPQVPVLEAPSAEAAPIEEEAPAPDAVETEAPTATAEAAPESVAAEIVLGVRAQSPIPTADVTAPLNGTAASVATALTPTSADATPVPPQTAPAPPQAPIPTLTPDAATLAPKPPFASSAAGQYFHHNQYSPAPKVVYTTSHTAANALLGRLQGPVIGLDMEWPIWATNPKTKKQYFCEQKTALIQVCDEKLIVLIHLVAGSNHTLPAKLVDMLKDRNVYKTGVNIKGDGAKLLKDFPGLFPKGLNSLLELSNVARCADPFVTPPGNKLVSLATQTKRYTDKELEKDPNVRQSNWALALNQKQIDYAANDTYAGLQIYLYLRRLAEVRNLPVDLDLCCITLGGDGKEKIGAVMPAITTVDGVTLAPLRLAPGQTAFPPPTQLGCLHRFRAGLSLEAISAETRGRLQRATVEGYICRSLSVLADDTLSAEEMKRLVPQFKENKFIRKAFKKLIVRLRRGAGEEGVESDAEMSDDEGGSQPASSQVPAASQATQPVAAAAPVQRIQPSPAAALAQVPAPYVAPTPARPQAPAPYVAPTQAPAPSPATQFPATQAPAASQPSRVTYGPLTLAPGQTKPPTGAQIKVMNHFRAGHDLATIATLVNVQRKTVETNMCKALEVLSHDTLNAEDRARLVPQLTEPTLFATFPAVIHRLKFGAPQATLPASQAARAPPAASQGPAAQAQPAASQAPPAPAPAPLRAQAPAYIPPPTQARPPAPTPAPYVAPPAPTQAAPKPAPAPAPYVAPYVPPPPVHLPIINPYYKVRKYEAAALKAFRSGKTIAAIAKKAQIQPKSAEQYICRALETKPDNYLTKEEKAKLVRQIKDGFTLRNFSEIIGRMKMANALPLPPLPPRAALVPISTATQGMINTAANTQAAPSSSQAAGVKRKAVPYVPGPGQIARYNEACSKPPTPSARRAVNLFCAGYTFDQIATANNWKRGTVCSYITSALLYLPKKELNKANAIRLGVEVKGEYKGEVYRQCMKKVRLAHKITPLDSDDEEESAQPAPKKQRVEAPATSSQAGPSTQGWTSSQGFSSSQGKSLAAPMTVEDLEFACIIPPLDANEAAEIEEEMRTLSQAY